MLVLPDTWNGEVKFLRCHRGRVEYRDFIFNACSII